MGTATANRIYDIPGIQRIRTSCELFRISSYDAARCVSQMYSVSECCIERFSCLLHHVLPGFTYDMPGIPTVANCLNCMFFKKKKKSVGIFYIELRGFSYDIVLSYFLLYLVPYGVFGRCSVDLF